MQALLFFTLIILKLTYYNHSFDTQVTDIQPGAVDTLSVVKTCRCYPDDLFYQQTVHLVVELGLCIRLGWTVSLRGKVHEL